MDPTFRALVKRELLDNLGNVPHLSQVMAIGSPVLILQPERVRQQYRKLQQLLPMVDHHYAIKALRHEAALAAVDECGGFFDVMTNDDVDMVQKQGVEAERCIHTDPIKRPCDIAYAYEYGIRTFVVENPAEVGKFEPYAGCTGPDRIQLMVRLAFRNPEAKSDLSTKFGVEPAEADRLVRHVRERGLDVAGFSLHVGSQIHSAQAFVEAIRTTTGLIDRVEREQGFRMSVLDIGGGFPVSYLEPAPELAEIAAAITPLLDPLTGRMRILSEPGRFVVAPSMTLISEVRGMAVRAGKQWYYIDDGLYGTYSSAKYEDVLQPIIALKELASDRDHELFPSVLGGPTCDSTDVIPGDVMLPRLEIGDRLVSPMMGAYTCASATDFNGIPRTGVIVVDVAAETAPGGSRRAA